MTRPASFSLSGVWVAVSLPQDPFIFKPTAGSDFGRFTSTQTPLNETKAGRVMQFALRYEF